MRIFHAEAGHANLGVAVGHVVAVAVGIEEQIRRLGHEHAAVADRDARGHVQAGDKILELVGAAVAVGVLADRDPVGPFRPVRRRLGDAVEDRPQKLIDADLFQAGGIRILQILHDPQPAALVVVDRDGLTDVRLGGE